jgi:hypothetical protein
MAITLSMEDLTLLSSTMYRTSTMIEAFRSIPPASTFLRDKLFGTVVTAATDNVMLDYFRANQKLAPFASRLKKGVTVPRERYKTNVFSPGVYGVDVITTGWQGIPIYSYEAQYEDSSGNSQFYCPPNCVLIASSLLQNRLTYAGVAQLSEDQSGTKGNY